MWFACFERDAPVQAQKVLTSKWDPSSAARAQPSKEIVAACKTVFKSPLDTVKREALRELLNARRRESQQSLSMSSENIMIWNVRARARRNSVREFEGVASACSSE
jgi:hypothetical protein